MIVYTAEDFAQANLATKGRFDVARRTDPSLAHQWHVYGSRQGYFSDEEMAADGWEPVMEDAAHDRIMTLLDTKKTHERAIAELRHDLAVALKERERFAGDLRRLYGHPKGDNAITLDALEVAWEAAEQAEECRKGDVLITRYAPEDGFKIGPAKSRGCVNSGVTRILSRAPKREPWADLADVLRAHTGEPDPDETARLLHERGVRVAGGEQK